MPRRISLLAFLGNRQGQVQDDADQGGQRDGTKAEGQGPAEGELQHAATDTDGEDDAADGQVPLVLIVDAALDQRAQAAGSDDTEEEHRDAAKDRARDGMDQGTELREEGEQDREDRGAAGHVDGVDARDGEHADVLAIRGIRRTTPKRGPRGGETVAGQGPVQARILVEVLADDLADRQGVTEVLADGGKADDDERQDGDQVELRHMHARQPEPSGILHPLEINQVVGGEEIAHDQGEDIAGGQTEEHRNDADEPLAVDIDDDRDCQSDHGDREEHQGVALRSIRIRVHGHVQGGRGQTHADDHDHAADDDWRQGLPQPSGSRLLDDGGDHQIGDAAKDRTAHRIGKSVRGTDGDQGGNERKGRTEEHRHLRSCAQDVDQRTGTCGEQGGVDIHSRENRNQDGRAKHGEHMLDTQRNPLRERRFVRRTVQHLRTHDEELLKECKI